MTLDTLSKEHRSWLMQRIRSVDTKPELIVRSMLHRAGFRFSLRRKDLPGKPDIVMPKYMTVIFVHGCFWHKHDPAVCRKPRPQPKTNTAFWDEKLQSNSRRDQDNIIALKKLGWRVYIIWECELQEDPFAVFFKLKTELQEEKSVEMPPCTFLDERVLDLAEKRHHYGLLSKTGSESFSGKKLKSRDKVSR